MPARKPRPRTDPRRPILFTASSDSDYQAAATEGGILYIVGDDARERSGKESHDIRQRRHAVPPWVASRRCHDLSSAKRRLGCDSDARHVGFWHTPVAAYT